MKGRFMGLKLVVPEVEIDLYKDGFVGLFV